MRKTKTAKPRSAALLDVVTRYQFLVLGVVAQIFILIVLSVGGGGSTTGEVDSLVNAIALITLVLLGVVLLLRWTHPMGNEEPIIILMLWILASTQASQFCVCCSPQPVDSHALAIAGSPPGAAVPQSHEERLHLAPSEEEEQDLAVAREEDDVDGDGEPEETLMHTLLMHTQTCRRDSFNLLFSLLALLLVLSAYCAELRPYYVALAFRLVTLTLLFLLVVLLVLAPSGCARFDLSDFFVQASRATLFHVLWFATHYKRLVERTITTGYQESLALTLPLLVARETSARARRLLPRAEDETTPTELFGAFDELGEYFAYKSERRERKETATSTPETSRSRHFFHWYEKSSEEAKSREKPAEEDEKIDAAMRELSAVNEASQEGVVSLLTYKNRAYSKQLARLIDLGQTLWVLLVCPLWLWFGLAQLTLLYFYIHRARLELMETNKLTRLVEAYTARRDSPGQSAFAVS